MPQRGDELLASRRAKLERLRQRDIDPYPARFHRTHTTAEAAHAFTEAEAAGGEGPAATLAGRIVRLRRMGKASFADIEDSEGRLQLFIRSDALGDDYALVDDLDLGDFAGASGTLIRTKMGEISLAAESLTLLAKAHRPRRRSSMACATWNRGTGSATWT